VSRVAKKSDPSVLVEVMRLRALQKGSLKEIIYVGARML